MGLHKRVGRVWRPLDRVVAKGPPVQSQPEVGVWWVAYGDRCELPEDLRKLLETTPKNLGPYHDP